MTPSEHPLSQHNEATEDTPIGTRWEDYARIATAINYISDNIDTQPSLEQIATQVNLSTSHFQRLFLRWAGVTPKQFLQVITQEHAKSILTASSLSNNELSDTLGLSSCSRLHDHFVTIEAVTPGEYKTQGAGLHIEYGLGKTGFGTVFIATTNRGICRLTFLDSTSVNADLSVLKKDWPRAQLTENNPRMQQLAETIFRPTFSHSTNSENTTSQNQTISLHVSGTNFQINVWKSLLRIPEGQLLAYSDIAHAIGKPNAVRALGTAIGANPVGYLIPCHRVIRQTGGLGGYRWGLVRKKALIGWELCRKDRL